MSAKLVDSLGSTYVFLSHVGAESQQAGDFAETLRRNGIKVWFDKDHIAPGDSWMDGLEQAISGACGMLVYIGRAGIHAWVDREVRYGLVLNTHKPDAFLFIPVLAEGAEITQLPPFVQQQQCVDLRDRKRAPEQIRRLVKVLGRSEPESAIPPDYWTRHSPFRSLRSFRAEDAWLFFGRDAETEESLARLRKAPVLTVIGNSGSGKSSLVQAGLIPALQRGRFTYRGRTSNTWRVAVFRPSASPMTYLAEALPQQLAPELTATERAGFIEHCKRAFSEGGSALRNAIAALPNAGDDTRIFLVADQFEELFTLTQDPALRGRYIDLLLTAADFDGPVPIHLVITLRADFYGHCLNYPNLRAALDQNIYNVPTVSPGALREAIESRLALASAGAEPGLIDALLADLGVEPGNLALLEHALGQLWDKSITPRRLLTNAAYTEIGRLQGALGRHADKVYAELDTDADRGLAQRIFPELVQLGEGAQDTRRRVSKASLLHLGDPARVERLIAQLASERLISTSAEDSQSTADTYVEVSHEALIRRWPLLQKWVRENREDLRLERGLLQAAEEWRRLERDRGALLRGGRLAQAREWLVRHPNPAPALVDFLRGSLEAEEEAARKELEHREREIARQNELRQEAEARAAAEARLRVAQETAAQHATMARDEALRTERGLNLDQRGWAVVFAASTPEAVRAELKPLLEKRRAQSRAKYKEFQFNPRTTSAASMLERYGLEPGPFGGSPFYLLLVGSPEEIPFEVQYELAAQHAVGRLFFQTPEEYRQYVQGVMSAESERERRRRAVLFGAVVDGDQATELLNRKLLAPIEEAFHNKDGPLTRYEWELDAVNRGEATKSKLSDLLKSDAPSLLFFGGHVMDASMRDPGTTGALLMSDWTPRSPIQPESVFGASDVPASANLTGSVLILFGGPTAGTSRFDPFPSTAKEPLQVSEVARLSPLSARLLSNEGGAALGVIGHVDRAWVSSFRSSSGFSAPGMFQSLVQRLMDGATVGLAMESFRLRSAQFATLLAGADAQSQSSPAALANLRTAALDVRNHILLGDPAAAIPVTHKN